MPTTLLEKTNNGGMTEWERRIYQKQQKEK